MTESGLGRPGNLGDLAREALEIAEEEIAFAKETGETRVIVSRLGNYKRQRDLARALLAALDDNERLTRERDTFAARLNRLDEQLNEVAAERQARSWRGDA